MSGITLAEAIEAGDLEAFIEQAEADGVGPIDREEFEGRLGRIIKAPLPEDQTSRSPGPDGSPGK